MKKAIYIFLILGAMLEISSCSTDFDLNANEEETTVIYGLLDQSDSIHYIRVTKSFLADGNAMTYAAIPDSSIYNNEDGTLEAWERPIQVKIEEVVNGSVMKTYVLNDTILPKKEGAFGNENGQLVYYFVESALTQTSTYRLEVDIDNGKKIVSAETNLIGSFNFTSQTRNKFNVGMSFASNNQTNKYPGVNIGWNVGTNGVRYELSLSFHYTEYLTGGDSIQRVINWNQGTFKAESGTTGFDFGVPGEAFYSLIKSVVPPLPSNVEKRVMRDVDVFVTVAGEELDTYIDVNEPSTGIVQEKPQYTNIDNGIGIFSSRFRLEQQGVFLNSASRKELATGVHTDGLGFCSDLFIDNLENGLYCN